MPLQNPLVEKYGTQKQWVNWKYDEREGKKTKVPVQPSGVFAKSTDKKTWNTYADLNPAYGAGIIFPLDKKMLGLDLDHFLTDGIIDEPYREMVEQLLEKANTYTEVSPSGTGLHLYFDLEKPTKLKKNRHNVENNGKQYGFEMYTSGRFFTVTQQSYGDPRVVRTVTVAELKEILAIIGYPWASPDSEREQATSTQENSATLTSHNPEIHTNISDDDILKKMFSAKNGGAIRALWNGDTSAHNDDESVADSALCCHLAFWCDKDATRVERMWASSPLGSRKKTQKRADYRTRTVQNAIRKTSDIYNWAEKAQKREERRLERADESGKDIEYLCTYNKDGKPKIVCNIENLTRFLCNHKDFADTLRFDEFSSKMEIRENGTWRPYKDGDEITYQRQASIIEPAFMMVSKTLMFDAMFSVSLDEKVNVAHDWIRSLVWDGTARVDTWLTSAFGVPDNEYYQSVGRNWLMAIAKRCHTPGAKFDHVLILEGPQGTKKSTALYTLGNVLPNRYWHMETTLDTGDKDFYVTLQGKLIVEFSEGETLSRSEVKQLKAIITTQVDTFRAPYGRGSQEYPRRGVFAMTTNMEEYLKDETGNRRYLPVKIEKEIDIDWLLANREQLYAEAYERVVRKNEKYWEFPQDELERMQDERRVSSANEESVAEWFSTIPPSVRENGIVIKEAWQGAFHGGVSMGSVMKKHEEMEIADIFKRVLKLEKRRTTVDGVKRWRWFEYEKMKSPVQFTRDEWGEIVEKED